MDKVEYCRKGDFLKMKRKKKMDLHQYIEAQNMEAKKREWEIIKNHLKEEGIWKDEYDEEPTKPEKRVCRKRKTTDK